MREHVAPVVYYFGIHLLFASSVWVAAWLLTSIRGVSATAKYWIWVATSLNFIVPLAAIVDKLGASHISWATPLGAIGDIGVAFSQNLAALAVLCSVWLSGTVAMLTRLYLHIRAERRAIQAGDWQRRSSAKRGFLFRGIQVRYVASHTSPAVDGLVRPHISLPLGIERVLSERELNAVLVHEVTHARRHDNLFRLLHELTLCLLWFHPLVWLTRPRVALYRELSCDEAVIHNSQGRDLVSALAKLANSDSSLWLRSAASSHLSQRLAQLTATAPGQQRMPANSLLAVVFGLVLLAAIFETIAHTACCFVVHT